MDAVLAGILGGKMGKSKLKPVGEALVMGDLVTEIGGLYTNQSALERIRPSTTNSIYAPEINTLDGTAILVTSSSNDGGYKFFNKIISIIDDSPMSGIAVSNSSVDLDGVEKVAYVPF